MIEEIRERMSTLDRRELVGLLVIGALIVGGVLFWYVRSLPAQVRVDGSSPQINAPGGSALPSRPSPSPGIVVAFIEDNGAPIEFLQVEKQEESWSTHRR